MSRGDPLNFDDDDDRPSRRRHRDRPDDDDDRPRRRDRDDDNLPDDPRPMRRPHKPGNGTGIGGLICGILGVVVALTSLGSFICIFCCFFVLPWAFATVGAALGLIAIILGLVSRSQGNPSSLPIWDIALGAVAIALAIVSIVLSFVLTDQLMNMPPPNNPQFQQQQQPRPNFNNNNVNNRPKR